jgi:hypothetical protein
LADRAIGWVKSVAAIDQGDEFGSEDGEFAHALVHFVELGV